MISLNIGKLLIFKSSTFECRTSSLLAQSLLDLTIQVATRSILAAKFARVGIDMTQISSLSGAMAAVIKGLRSSITSATKVASTTGTGEKTGNAAIKDYLTREESMAMTTPTEENHDLLMGNITTLDYKATLDQYNGLKGMIESGQINDFNFRGYNGADQAESAGQYLFWLQAHMQEIGGGEAEVGKE